MGVSQTLTVTVKNHSVAGKYTDVLVELRSTQTGASYNNITGRAFVYFTISGSAGYQTAEFEAGSITYTLPKNSTVLIYSKTHRIYHNTGGVAPVVKVRTWLDTRISEGVIQKTQTVTLPIVPAPTVPAFNKNSAYIGDTVAVTLQNAIAGCTHKVSYSYGAGWNVLAESVGTSYSWLVPDISWRIPNDASLILKFRCETMYKGALVGESIVNITAKVPESAMPMVGTFTVTDQDSSITQQFGAFIQNKSVLALEATASGAMSSTVADDKYTLEFDGVRKYEPTWFMAEPVKKAGSLVARAWVQDSRSRYSEIRSKTVNVLEYFKPRVSRFQVRRVDASGNADDNGLYAAISYAYEVAPCNNKNTVSAVFEYRKTTDTEWTELTTKTALSADEEIKPASVTFSLENQYQMRLVVTDWFDEQDTYSGVLPSDKVVLEILADGTGIAFGKTAERSGADFGFDAKGRVLGLGAATASVASGDNLNAYTQLGVFAVRTNAIAASLLNCPSKAGGTLRVYSGPGTGVASGAYVSLIQEYRSLTMTEPTFRRLLSTNASGVWSYGPWVQDTTALITTGTWQPDIPEASIIEASGRYAKVGKMVTLSWRVVATANSTKFIRVSGVPFLAATPNPVGVDDLFDVAGGGGYMTGTAPGGRTFSGWALHRAGNNANPTFWNNSIVAMCAGGVYFSVAVGDRIEGGGTLMYETDE